MTIILHILITTITKDKYKKKKTFKRPLVTVHICKRRLYSIGVEFYKSVLRDITTVLFK